MAESVAPWLEALSERDRDAVRQLVDDAPPLPRPALDLLHATGCPMLPDTKGRAA